MDFLCASGALGLDGQGYFWEWPLVYANIIRPHELTIITKTLTRFPCPGNLSWWHPWTCFRFIKDGTVNSVGLSNPGIRWWIKHFPRFPQYKFIISILPTSVREAAFMAQMLNPLPVVGIEFNASCPNGEEWTEDKICELSSTLALASRHPVIVKLGYTQPYVRVCEHLDGVVAAFDLINSVPWPEIFPNAASPLNPSGGVSGAVIVHQAREALWKAKVVTTKTPIISGGGINDMREVVVRRCMGAEAWTFGTLFLRKPWLPNRIAASLRKLWLY
jgi:dihydroorotate dehydrogenase